MCKQQIAPVGTWRYTRRGQEQPRRTHQIILKQKPNKNHIVFSLYDRHRCCSRRGRGHHGMVYTFHVTTKTRQNQKRRDSHSHYLWFLLVRRQCRRLILYFGLLAVQHNTLSTRKKVEMKLLFIRYTCVACIRIRLYIEYMLFLSVCLTGIMLSFVTVERSRMHAYGVQCTCLFCGHVEEHSQ